MTLSLLLFLIIVAITLGITYWAAKQTKTTAQFYAAGRKITAWQNGVAVAGDYMSAASFLGIAGLIALNGYDGFMYSVGWLVAYLTVLLVVAEPLRNTGKFTMADVLAYRLKAGPVRSVAALSTLVVTIFYMLAQMVGAGKLIKLFFPMLTPTMAISIIGVLMIIYVVYGGMVATTWVQIVKAVMLMAGTIILSFLVLNHFGWNISKMMDAAAARAVAENGAKVKEAAQFLQPGLLYKNPIELVSLGLALVLGTAGLPHILVRFYTVPDAKAARGSVVWAMILIGAFYIMTTFLGFGAAALAGFTEITRVDKAGNMAAPLLAKALGEDLFGTVGGEFFLAFIGAVAFATILAVVAGLTIAGSSAFAHDFYTNVLRKGRATEQEQVKVARYTAFGLGALAILLAIGAQNMNVAYLVALAFAVASSGNLPTIVFSLFWRRFNTAGAISGLIVGLVASVGLVVFGPQAAPGLGLPILFPLANPGIISIPLGFLGAYLGTILTSEPEAERKFTELYVRAQTGIGAE